MFQTCKHKGWVLSDWIIVNCAWYYLRLAIIINWHCVFVLSQTISFQTIGSIWKKLSYNGKSKYKIKQTKVKQSVGQFISKGHPSIIIYKLLFYYIVVISNIIFFPYS